MHKVETPESVDKEKREVNVNQCLPLKRSE